MCRQNKRYQIIQRTAISTFKSTNSLPFLSSKPSRPTTTAKFIFMNFNGSLFSVGSYFHPKALWSAPERQQSGEDSKWSPHFPVCQFIEFNEFHWSRVEPSSEHTMRPNDVSIRWTELSLLCCMFGTSIWTAWYWFKMIRIFGRYRWTYCSIFSMALESFWWASNLLANYGWSTGELLVSLTQKSISTESAALLANGHRAYVTDNWRMLFKCFI